MSCCREEREPEPEPESVLSVVRAWYPLACCTVTLSRCLDVELASLAVNTTTVYKVKISAWIHNTVRWADGFNGSLAFEIQLKSNVFIFRKHGWFFCFHIRTNRARVREPAGVFCPEIERDCNFIHRSFGWENKVWRLISTFINQTKAVIEFFDMWLQVADIKNTAENYKPTQN